MFFMMELFFLEPIPPKTSFGASSGASSSWSLLLMEPPHKYTLSKIDVFQGFYKRI